MQHETKERLLSLSKALKDQLRVWEFPEEELMELSYNGFTSILENHDRRYDEIERIVAALDETIAHWE